MSSTAPHTYESFGHPESKPQNHQALFATGKVMVLVFIAIPCMLLAGIIGLAGAANMSTETGVALIASAVLGFIGWVIILNTYYNTANDLEKSPFWHEFFKLFLLGSRDTSHGDE
jgi:hypothetical protein